MCHDPRNPPLIAGNWKMNGTLREALALAGACATGRAGAADLLICPPFLHLHRWRQALDGRRAIGGQDCHAAAKGAHTGDVSAAMLAMSARHVILGHSERRANHGETDAAGAGQGGGGDRGRADAGHLRRRDRGAAAAGEAEAVVPGQLEGSLPEGFAAAGGVVAYEPVWAIGTGRTPTEAEIAAMHKGSGRSGLALWRAGGGLRIL